MIDMAVKCPVCESQRPSAVLKVKTLELGQVSLQICGKCGVVYAPARPPVVPGW